MAIIMANAFSYATPSTDANSANKKQKSWEKFVRAFDWDAMVEKKDNPPTLGGFISMFRSSGIMTKGGQ